MAAVLEQLGFTVHRRLGRVHSHASTRTHMSLDVGARERVGCGSSIPDSACRSPARYLEREDGAQREEWFGTMSLHRLETADGSAEAWELRRGEDLQHITDLFEVVPADVPAAHHITSTMVGGGPMRTNLIFGRYVEGGHVMITRDARTVRRDGEPTEHEEIASARPSRRSRSSGTRWTGTPCGSSNRSSTRRAESERIVRAPVCQAPVPCRP